MIHRVVQPTAVGELKAVALHRQCRVQRRLLIGFFALACASGGKFLLGMKAAQDADVVRRSGFQVVNAKGVRQAGLGMLSTPRGVLSFGMNSRNSETSFTMLEKSVCVGEPSRRCWFSLLDRNASLEMRNSGARIDLTAGLAPAGSRMQLAIADSMTVCKLLEMKNYVEQTFRLKRSKEESRLGFVNERSEPPFGGGGAPEEASP